MQQKISMDLLICNSEDKISLDEIVHAVSSAYESKAFAELLKLILSIIQPARGGLAAVPTAPAGGLIFPGPSIPAASPIILPKPGRRGEPPMERTTLSERLPNTIRCSLVMVFGESGK